MQALPAMVCQGLPTRGPSEDEQTVIWREGDCICISMHRRKNRPSGSGTLKRICSCSSDPRMCAVHELWDKYLGSLPDGTRPWHGVSPGFARQRLRRILELLSVPESSEYGLHDFRRGHAEDMRKCGCTLAQIMRAGQWKSAAFMTYLNEMEIDKAVASGLSVWLVRMSADLSPRI